VGKFLELQNFEKCLRAKGEVVDWRFAYLFGEDI
jgi:hypothetical protein